MDYEPVELSRERAASSEPCSTRPNPFNDNEPPSRKRQRVSRGGSRSRSADTARASIATPDSMDLREQTVEAESDPAPPRTPPPKSSEPHPPEPTSSRVTINLRTTRDLESSSSPSPTADTKMRNGGENGSTRVSDESGSDAVSTIPAIETPSSSSSAIGSPEIELVSLNEEDDFAPDNPPVAIINDDDLLDEVMLGFPYLDHHETLQNAAKKLAHFIQYETLEQEECFCKLRDWIDSFMVAIGKYPESWHEMYLKYTPFWKEFPYVVTALSERSRFFGTFLESPRQSSRALSEFMCQFARMTAKFVAMDVWMLANHAKQGGNDNFPDLGSMNYLRAFSSLLKKEDSSNIGKNLEVHYNWNWDEEIVLLLHAFHTEGGSIAMLTKINEGRLSQSSRSAKIIDSLSDSCRIVQLSHLQVYRVLRDTAAYRQEDVEFAHQQLAQSYRFFQPISAALHCIIEKHVTSLNHKTAETMFNSLAIILRDGLHYDDTLCRPVLEQMHRENPQLPLRSLPMIISTEWKFNVLKKLIMSTQMQLRISGITAMYSDLLRLFNENKLPDASQSPILIYFANFIINNKIIEYLVGIGSHPEVINESNNILGFLVVTKTYTEEQAAATWQTVTNSQDPRVVEAILRMIKHCFNLQDYESLLLLCKQVNTLSIEGFTPGMREFFAALVSELMRKADQLNLTYIDAPPYETCVRLMRESSRLTPDYSGGQPDVQNYAGGRLRELLSHGPAPAIRHEIYSECIADVAVRTDTAPGSICVINALLRQNVVTDIRILTTEHGLTKLVIQELQSAAESNHQSIDKDSPAAIARREIIRYIIMNEPGTISPSLGEQLWNLLVGEKSRSVEDRNISWQMLNIAMKRSSLHNVFLETCFRNHLPALPSNFFTAGTLDFIRDAIYAWLDVGSNFVDSSPDFQTFALDQLWRIILEAPSNTIDAQAIRVLVELYVDSSLISTLSRSNAKGVHLALVNRCLKQLAAAAAKLKSYDPKNASKENGDAMLLDDTDDDFQNQEMIFARSLAVLREFLRAYQSKPQFATAKPKPLLNGASNVTEGENLTVKYQSFDGNTHTQVKDLTFNKRDPVGSLFARLEKETGFKNYKVYCNGKVVDPEEVVVCKSLEDLKLGGLVLVQRRDDQESSSTVAAHSKTTIEFEIIKHFDELWGYLSMHEKVAKEIYLFLVKFSIYERLQQDLANVDVPYSAIFPKWQPFKSLYAIYALRESTVTQVQLGTLDEAALSRAVTLLASAISDPDVLDCCPDQNLKDSLALNLVDLFIDLLREPILPATAISSLDTALLKRLVYMLYEAKSDIASQTTLTLTWKCFEAILEASLHNPDLWTSFKMHMDDTDLLQQLLLDDPRPTIRKSVVKLIVTKCSIVQSGAGVTTDEFTTAFWPMISSMVPETTKFPHQCDDLFSLCLALFKRIGDLPSAERMDIESLLRSWAGLLLSHTSNERVDHPERVDLIVQGLANLCLCAVSFSKILQRPLSCSEIGVKLFRKHLFPELSQDVFEHDDDVIEPRIPLLNSMSRHTISETIFYLIKDDEVQYRKLLALMHDLVPYDLVEDVPYVYDLPYLFERCRAVRSSTGYVGLRNLSNTCYLNSLLTQLFMNVSFREFMLNKGIVDGTSQRLLSETQSLFAHMQSTLKRFVDPSGLAMSIRTWEDANIDVNVQMDVDEFYNLLFDRWESQFTAEDEKRTFRSFYSGQTLQQVKSKECPHISERQETFAAISCDVKGKTSLNDSLQAYVDGEVMEGDNKYKCSTCDRHVDAVRRTCLKDLPDNLIFHLKRFDFNLRTAARSKLNEHFTFPDRIDMRPYKVEHLMNTPDGSPSDVFELVGILVHSGTAESGHYFSYIKERPSNANDPRWVEFNDDLVSRWDPQFKESKCFGGFDMGGNFQLEKQYSAYMLFYQRTSVLESQDLELKRSGKPSPVRLPLAPRIQNHLEMENEMVLRKHCLYDPSHPAFVNKVLLNIKNINKGRCSEVHELEKNAIIVALNHLDQVVSRTKDTPDFINSMLSIRQLCHSCAECSRDFLEWFCERPEGLRNLLLRNPEPLIRSEMASSILAALAKVKKEIPYAYGLSLDDNSSDVLDTDEPRLIHKVVEAISNLWDQFHSSCRAWPEYFGLIASIATVGNAEAAILMDFGFLRKVVEVISADLNLSPSSQYIRMLNIVSKRISTRPVSYEAVIGLLHVFLKECDFTARQIANNEDRLDIALNDQPLPLTDTETKLLLQHWVRTQSHILTEKLLMLNQNPFATTQILIILLKHMSNIDHNIYQAITHGIRKGSTPTPSAPFLRAAITYCEHSSDLDAIDHMATHVAKVARNIDNVEGGEYLQFFKNLLALPSNRGDISPEDIHDFSLDLIPIWAPALLNYWDVTVREDTEVFLSELLVGARGMLSETDDEDVKTLNHIVQATQKLGIECLSFLQDTYLSPPQQAIRLTLEPMLRVIESCTQDFNEDEEDNIFFLKKRAILPTLRKQTVEEAEEEASDWENSDGEYPSSEPMDNIAELIQLDMGNLPR